jgi:uncharacterized protein with von Willebrand factor type A (vWA) domain
MELEPNPNQTDPNAIPSKSESPFSPHPGGDSININGPVGPGVVVGRGTVYAQQIAGGDIILNGSAVDKQRSFADLLQDLKDLIEQAKQAGELTVKVADEVTRDLDSARELVEKDQPPPKHTLVEKLQHVAATLDRALETLENNRSPVMILIKALPFVALLIRLANQIF